MTGSNDDNNEVVIFTKHSPTFHNAPELCDNAGKYVPLTYAASKCELSIDCKKYLEI